MAEPRFPTWVIPLEIVIACANGTGTAMIVRRKLAGALFKPHALVTLLPRGFIADLAYEEPAYPGREQILPVLLAAVPHENAVVGAEPMSAAVGRGG